MKLSATVVLLLAIVSATARDATLRGRISVGSKKKNSCKHCGQVAHDFYKVLEMVMAEEIKDGKPPPTRNACTETKPFSASVREAYNKAHKLSTDAKDGLAIYTKAEAEEYPPDEERKHESHKHGKAGGELQNFAKVYCTRCIKALKKNGGDGMISLAEPWQHVLDLLTGAPTACKTAETACTKAGAKEQLKKAGLELHKEHN